jgi:hypothetical protein
VRSGRAVLGVGLALAALGVAVRLNNALRYPMGYGYDEPQNWRYVERLLESWALPDPDADWSTSHPPLFYYLAAGVGRLLAGLDPAFTFLAVRLLDSAGGLLVVALAVALVRRIDPGDSERALLAGGLLLFLPAQLALSPMLHEEALASTLVSLAVAGTAAGLAGPDGLPSGRRAAGIGLAGGLAWLTKFSGCLVVLASAAALALDGGRRRGPARGAALASLALAVALAAGGWYYARSWLRYGYLYPHDLELHARMHTMPPGVRRVTDYLRVPLATWTDPVATNPDLLRSVWGTSYASWWFDAHRHFLPRESRRVTAAGTLILALALVPTAGLALGLARGLRRAWRAPGPDTPLLLLVGLTGAGYLAFTWRNPWFAAVKGSYLLGLAVPFAYYASEGLALWTRRGGPGAWLVRAALALLALAVAVAFSFGQGLWSFDHLEWPGLRWTAPRLR